MINCKSNVEILSIFNDLVRGHISAKKSLINLVNRSKIRHHQKMLQGVTDLMEPSKCLLVGGSGTGKTFLVDTLQSIVKFPLVKIDATKLTVTSATGGVKNDDLLTLIRNNAKELVAKKDGYYHSVEGTIDQTVVFIDEVDKLAWGAGEGDGWNKRVQANFLTLIENKGEFEGVSFIFAGAFSGISQDVKKSIGFTHSKENTVNRIDEQIVRYGLIPELIGRINNIIELDKFTRADLQDILENKLVPKKAIDLNKFNHTMFKPTQEQIDIILDRAEESGQGARFLKRELEALTVDMEFEEAHVTV